jgi:hypothetical protein
MRRFLALGIVGLGISLLTVVATGCGPNPFVLLQDQIDTLTAQLADAEANLAAQGDPGVPGTKGDTGATGATGASGANGVDGAAGRNGTNGTNGQNGAPGQNGTNGTNGQNGASGQNGTDGANGTNGQPCWDLNGNGVGDPEEDLNGDGVVDVNDCEWVGLLARTHVGADGTADAQDTNGPYLESLPVDPNVPGKFVLILHFAPNYRFAQGVDLRSFPILVTPFSFTALPGQPPTTPISAMVEPVELNEAAKTLEFNVYEIQWSPNGPAPINMDFYVMVMEP